MFYTVKRKYTAEITETWVVSAPKNSPDTIVKEFAKKYIDGHQDPDDQVVKKIGPDTLSVDPH